jgi:hypothetical protein
MIPTQVAARDQNFITGKLAVLNTDAVQGQNLVPIAIDGATGAILVTTTATISFTMKPIDPRDQNFVPCWLFEGLDGKVYPAVATALGELLIDTT